jgi:hypothetical protein
MVKASSDTGGLQTQFLSIQTEIALHHGSVGAILRHTEWTAGQAGVTADAPGLVHHDDAVFGSLLYCSHRADCRTERLSAVHTGERTVRHCYVWEYALFNRGDRPEPGTLAQLVPFLAGNLARLAGNTILRFDQKSVLFHLLLLFLTVNSSKYEAHNFKTPK